MVRPTEPSAAAGYRAARLEEALYPAAPTLLAAVAAIVAVSVLAFPFFGVQLPDFSVYLRAAGFDGMNMAGLMGIFVLFLCSRPRPEQTLYVSVAALLAETFIFATRPSDLGALPRLNLLGVGFAGAGLGGLVWQTGISRGAARRRVLGLLSVAGVLLLYGSMSVVFLGLLSHLTPQVFDAYIYRLESAFGLPIPVMVARMLESHPTLQAIVMATYVRLTLFVAIGFYLNLRYPEATTSNLVAGFLLALFCCFPLYLVLPMVGIDMFIGSPPWPLEPPPTDFALKWVGAPPWLPRTCAPSMHATWVYLFFFSVYRLNRPVMIGSLGVVVLTLLGTMSKTVGHYAIDIVLAVPLAVAVQAAVTFPTCGNRRLRIGIAAGGLLVTVASCSILRWGIHAVLAHPVLFCTMQTLLVMAFLIAEYRLGRITLREMNSSDKIKSPP